MYGLDADIKQTQSHIKEQEKKFGAWTIPAQNLGK